MFVSSVAIGLICLFSMSRMVSLGSAGLGPDFDELIVPTGYSYYGQVCVYSHTIHCIVKLGEERK
jgi:hypothetical protein